METDIENEIIPKDVTLGRMCNDKMHGAIEVVNGVILKSSNKGQRIAAIAYNVQFLEMREMVPILKELLENTGYYVQIDPDYSAMVTRLIIRW